jgi:phage regulator Rha-like protein
MFEVPNWHLEHRTKGLRFQTGTSNLIKNDCKLLHMSKEEASLSTITGEEIIEKIFIIRGQKVMLDKDLADMYGVETFNLNKSVKRNSNRFPIDFMFQLTKEEFESLRFQIGISKKGRGGARYLPYAFTEQGVAMLSSVLRSETAIQVNIQIIRIFTKMKQLLMDNKDILLRMEKFEQAMLQKDDEVKAIFKILKKLLEQPAPTPMEPIGFPYPNKK